MRETTFDYLLRDELEQLLADIKEGRRERNPELAQAVRTLLRAQQDRRAADSMFGAPAHDDH